MEQILVVDDHTDIARVLAESWLPAIGYQAQGTTGSAVHTILQHDTFDLVLLDFHSVDSSGIERLELIRREHPDLPVILMVAPGAEKRAVEAFQLGIRNYLLKPFSFDQLQHAVEEVLREQRLARENQHLTRHLRQRIHELIVLSAIGRSVTRAVDLDEVLKRIVEAALNLTHAEEGVLLLRDGDQLRIRAAHTQRDSGMWFANESFPHHAAEQVLHTWQPVHVAPQSLFINPVQPVQNGLLVPLLANGEILGALGIANVVRTEPFAGEHERLLAALADYAAIAIENARLFAALERSEARYRDLFRNASDLLLVVDHRWQIVEANSLAPRLLGRSEDEMVGQPLQSIIAPEHWPLLHRRLAHLLHANAAITPFEVDLIKPGGRRVPVELSARLLHHDDTPVVVCRFHDLTERLLHAQIAHAEKLSAIEHVVAGIAHELNNPLASIAGYSQLLLRDQQLSAATREDLEQVLQQSRRAGQMVQQLITVGQDLQFSSNPLDLNTLIGSALDLAPVQADDTIHVVRDLAPSLPLVTGDPYQLQHVLLHVLNNATRAMQPGGGTLSLRTYAVEDAAQIMTPQPSSPLPTMLDGPLVVVEVRDTGVGIAAHQLNRIFDHFWTTHDVGEGPGLGLSISWGVMARHGGHIWVHSIEGRGTTVYLALPVMSVSHTHSDGGPSSQTTHGAPEQMAESYLKIPVFRQRM